VPLYGAAVSPATARFVGGWADGLLTTASADVGAVRRVVDAFHAGGGEGKPVILQAALSWAGTEDDAVAQALDQWRHCTIGGEAVWDLRRPGDFDAVSRTAGPDDLRRALPISASLSFHADWIGRLLELGPTELHLHGVGGNQLEFIETFGSRVLPSLGQRPVGQTRPRPRRSRGAGPAGGPRGDARGSAPAVDRRRRGQRRILPGQRPSRRQQVRLTVEAPGASVAMKVGPPDGTRGRTPKFRRASKLRG
jgi:hypothetical protein